MDNAISWTLPSSSMASMLTSAGFLAVVDDTHEALANRIGSGGEQGYQVILGIRGCGRNGDGDWDASAPQNG